MILPIDLARWEDLMRFSGCFAETWIIAPNPRDKAELILGPDHEMGARATMSDWLEEEALLWCEVRNALPEILEVLRAEIRA